MEAQNEGNFLLAVIAVVESKDDYYPKLQLAVFVWCIFTTKQRKVGCPHFYFKRIADSHIRRFQETVKLTSNNDHVVSIGLPGIGKSSEINGSLLKFLPHLRRR